LEVDPDLEPSLGSGMNGGDVREDEPEHDEPSLGWTDQGVMGGIDDREQDRSDDEPSLAAAEAHPSCYMGNGHNSTDDQTAWAAGGVDDREDEHDGGEVDSWPAPAARG
jgi:hypothetical protein